MITEAEYLKALETVKAYRIQILESASEVLENIDNTRQYERMCTKMRCKNNRGLNHKQSTAYLTVGKIYKKLPYRALGRERDDMFRYKDDRGRMQSAMYDSPGTRDRWEFIP